VKRYPEPLFKSFRELVVLTIVFQLSVLGFWAYGYPFDLKYFCAVVACPAIGFGYIAEYNKAKRYRALLVFLLLEVPNVFLALLFGRASILQFLPFLAATPVVFLAGGALSWYWSRRQASANNSGPRRRSHE
jgi:hypothetical protein